MNINMLKVDVPKFLVSLLTFSTILRMLYGINKIAILDTYDLLNEAFGGEVAEEEEAFCAKCAGKTD